MPRQNVSDTKRVTPIVKDKLDQLIRLILDEADAGRCGWHGMRACDAVEYLYEGLIVQGHARWRGTYTSSLKLGIYPGTLKKRLRYYQNGIGVPAKWIQLNKPKQ